MQAHICRMRHEELLDCLKGTNVVQMRLRSPFLQGLLEGEFPLSGTPCICDVRDLARAHILAAELPLQQLDSRYGMPGSLPHRASVQRLREV